MGEHRVAFGPNKQTPARPAEQQDPSRRTTGKRAIQAVAKNKKQNANQAPMPLQPADQHRTIRRAKTNRRKTRRTAAEPNKSDAPSKIPARYQRKATKAKQIRCSNEPPSKSNHPTIELPKPSNTIQSSNHLTPSISINQSNQSNHSINQSNQPINQPIQSTNQSTNPINQPTTQTTNHSINQSTKHPITATIKLQLTIQITNKHSTPTFNNKTQHSNHPTSSKTCEQSRKPRRQIKPAFKGCPERSQ